ncbi:MAG: rhomboid family intramembrane serine protease [Deltaproteobacteria bacterium]|nr:rhomboid family intramembrane serine protease [Deltaproteobacteria bacterium]
MFLPIGDTPNPQRFTPWMNYALISANILIYLIIALPLSFRGIDPADGNLLLYLRMLQPSLSPGVSPLALLAELSAYDLFVFVHGYKPAAPEVSDLFTSLFLHAGWLHLAGNMLFLWIFGDNVEHRLGRLGYLAVYLAAGVAATLAFALLVGSSWTPLIGASGAISGVMGIYFLLFGVNRVKVLVVLFPFFVDVLLLPARWVLGLLIVVDNVLPLLLGTRGGVAYGAHLGGFLAGLAVAWAGERLAWCWPWEDRQWRLGSPLRRVSSAEATLPVDAAPGEGALSVLCQKMAAGDQAAALQQLFRLERRDLGRLSPGECVTLAGWLEQAGHPIAANLLLCRCLTTNARSVDLAQVYLALGLQRLAQGQSTAAFQHLLSVFDHDPDAETASRAREALSRIQVFRRSGQDGQGGASW